MEFSHEFSNEDAWQEDDMVVELVGRYGPKRWSLIAAHLKGRIGKQCRERYAFIYFKFIDVLLHSHN